MKYAAPTSIEEATELLDSVSGARVFAGATDVMPQARAGRALADLMVDLKRIPRLTQMSNGGNKWVIGAATAASRVAGDPAFRAAFPGLAEATALIGSDQVQNRASLGGNLCNASPAADTGPSLCVNGTVAVIATAGGERRVPVAEITTGPGRTSLEEGEFIIEFVLDSPPPRSSDAYLRFTPRTEMDIAVVGAASRVTLDESGEIADAAVVLGAVAPTTVEVEGVSALLSGKRIDEDLLEQLAQAAMAVCNPIDDKRGTIDFRRKVAGVLVKRTITTAVSRAEGK